jgi:hypothetical protein
MARSQLKWLAFTVGGVALLGMAAAFLSRQGGGPLAPNAQLPSPSASNSPSHTANGQSTPPLNAIENVPSLAERAAQARSTMNFPAPPNNDIESMLAMQPGLSEETKQKVRAAMGKLQRREVQDVPIGPGLEQMYTRVQSSLKPINEYAKRMVSKPTDIGATRLAKAQDLGAMPDGGSTPEGWSGASRTFRDADLGLVILEENDLRISHGGRVLAREAINESVNGAAAVLAYERDPKTGTTRTNLAWSTAERSYSLTMEPIDAESTALLLEIAKGLRP